MQDLIDAAVIAGKTAYEEERQKKSMNASEREMKRQMDMAAKLPLAMLWVTEELPELVTKEVSKNPNQKEILLVTIPQYKNKMLEDELLHDACKKLGLQTRVAHGSMRYYDEGELIDYVSYYVVLCP